MEEPEYTIVINANLEDMQDTGITDRESLCEFMFGELENAFGDFFLKVERGMKCLK